MSLNLLPVTMTELVLKMGPPLVVLGGGRSTPFSRMHAANLSSAFLALGELAKWLKCVGAACPAHRLAAPS